MYRKIICLAALVVVAAAPAPALADQPSVGLNINLIMGSFQGSSRQGARLPTIPLPAITLNVPVGAFALRAEDVPPIGPFQYGDGFGGTQSTKLGYFNAIVAWHTPNNRYEFGVGTSILNQITYYSGSSVTEQASRVTGLRLSGRVRLEDSGHTVTDLTIAASPSMRGLQITRIQNPIPFIDPCLPAPGPCPPTFSSVLDVEAASLVDVMAQRLQQHGAFQLRYGLRYVNYVAHFPAFNAPADHDVGFMPFAGVAFLLGHR